MIYGINSGGFNCTDLRATIQERRVEPIVASDSNYSQGNRGGDYSGKRDENNNYSPFRKYFETGLGNLIDKAA